jgi:hypothetical protein
MPHATSVSLAKFQEAVQAAVKSAVQKHPKFRMEAPNKLAVSYLIRGIPVPEALVANMSVKETQAFANDVAAELGRSVPGIAAGGRVEGVLYSHGDHLIIGIPAITDILLER